MTEKTIDETENIAEEALKDESADVSAKKENTEYAEEKAEDIAENADEEAENQTGSESEKEEKSEKHSFREKKKLNAEIKKLTDSLNESEKNVSELKDRYTRLAAEFDNYKKRTARELDGRYEDAKGDTWKNILPVIDNFERAMNTEKGTEPDPFREGIELIYKQLCEAMKNAGVNEIEAEGKEFNPELHNAVMHVEDENYGENTVVQVFMKGYTLGDKVIRHSMVKVAN